MKKILLFISAITFAAFFLSGITCEAQGLVNVSFESAKRLGQGRFDIKPVFTHYSYSYKGQTESVGNHYGAIFGVGISQNFDLKARYERAVSTETEYGRSHSDYFSLIPKVGFTKNVSFLVPFSLYTSSHYGETWNLYSIAPSLLATLPVLPNKADVSASIKGDILFGEGESEGMLGFTLGAGISNDLNFWAIRPEVGYMIHPGDDGGQWSWGLSLQLLFGKKAK